eukprot:1356713-Amorphochlora_amoeboformis.AAC.1
MYGYDFAQAKAIYIKFTVSDRARLWLELGLCVVCDGFKIGLRLWGELEGWLAEGWVESGLGYFGDGF